MQILKHESSYYQTTGFKWKQRIGFGISDYACNLAYLLANTYLLFYYTNCAVPSHFCIGMIQHSAYNVICNCINKFCNYEHKTYCSRR